MFTLTLFTSASSPDRFVYSIKHILSSELHIKKKKIIEFIQVRLGLCMNGQADVKELRDILSSDTGIELSRMLLTEIDDQGFLRTHSGKKLHLTTYNC